MGYLLASGDVYIGTYVAGVLGALTKFHCPTFELEVSAEYAEHKNSSEVIRVRDARVAREQMAKLAMSIDTHDPEVLAMAVGGEVATDAGTSFSAKAFPSGLAVGNIVPIPGNYTDLSSLTIVDSTGSPVTLVLGTHYSVDMDAGLITILSLTSITQPLKASGATTAGGKIISVSTKATVEKFIRFVGTNYDNTRVMADIHRAQIPPTKIPIKTDGNDFAKFDFAPELLADPSAPFSQAYGKYALVKTFA